MSIGDQLVVFNKTEFKNTVPVHDESLEYENGSLVRLNTMLSEAIGVIPPGTGTIGDQNGQFNPVIKLGKQGDPYVNGGVYGPGDVVAYGDSYYVATSFIANVSPDTEGSDWLLLAIVTTNGRNGMYLGEYMGLRYYFTNAIVFYEGKLYMNNTNSTLLPNTLPTSEYWDLIADNSSDEVTTTTVYTGMASAAVYEPPGNAVTLIVEMIGAGGGTLAPTTALASGAYITMGGGGGGGKLTEVINYPDIESSYSYRAGRANVGGNGNSSYFGSAVAGGGRRGDYSTGTGTVAAAGGAGGTFNRTINTAHASYGNRGGTSSARPLIRVIGEGGAGAGGRKGGFIRPWDGGGGAYGAYSGIGGGGRGWVDNDGGGGTFNSGAGEHGYVKISTVTIGAIS